MKLSARAASICLSGRKLEADGSCEAKEDRAMKDKLSGAGSAILKNLRIS